MDPYIPPPVPLPLEVRIRRARVFMVVCALFLIGAVIYLVNDGMPLWQAIVSLLPLAAIFGFVIYGVLGSPDRIVKVVGALGMAVSAIAFLLSFFGGR